MVPEGSSAAAAACRDAPGDTFAWRLEFSLAERDRRAVSQPDTERPDKEQFVTSLARGLTVIRAFNSGHPAEMTLSEIAVAAELNPAAARRLLLTLVELGYVAKHGKRFVLTPRILELSAGYLDSLNISAVAMPYLQNVLETTGDSTSLTVLDAGDIIHICHLPTQRFLQFAVSPGSRIPAHVSSSGQAMLALAEEPELSRYFTSTALTRRTARTLVTEEAIRARLAEIRHDGYALAVDELDLGVTSIGVAIVADGRAAAGLSCATLSGYVPLDEYVRSRLPALQQAATLLARELQRVPALLHSLALGSV